MNVYFSYESEGRAPNGNVEYHNVVLLQDIGDYLKVGMKFRSAVYSEHESVVCFSEGELPPDVLRDRLVLWFLGGDNVIGV